MHPIIKPIYSLMNRLSYRGKFILMCSVFAIPLGIFAIQLALSFHQNAHQSQVIREGLNYIKNNNLLVLELETLRDLKVITALTDDPVFVARHQESHQKTLKLIAKLLDKKSTNARQQFLLDLKRTVESEAILKGTASTGIDVIYEYAHDMVDKAYKWRIKQSYRFISLSDNNPYILSIVNLLNEVDLFTRTLGKTRSYGTFYLIQADNDTNDTKLLEKNYQHLSQLIDLLDSKDTEYQPFHTDFPSAKLGLIKTALEEARATINQQLIMAQDLNSNPEAYFDEITRQLSLIYVYKISLFDLSKSIVEQNYRTSMRQLIAFYLAVFFIAVLIGYLTLGLYHSMSVTIRELLSAAAAFSKGHYDTPVKVISSDEFKVVAEAMDNMRINIKEREEELARLSQTDDLTGLSNRKFFNHALQVSLANSRRNYTPLITGDDGY